MQSEIGQEQEARQALMEQFAEAGVSGHARSSCSTVQAAVLYEDYWSKLIVQMVAGTLLAAR